MVEQNRSGAFTEIVYAPNGAKLALMNGPSTLKQAFVPLPAGAAAVYNSSGLAYYRHPDWLGSSRFASTPTTRAMYFDGAYAPFGEPYAQTGTTDLSFTGMNQDTASALYDFPAREYGIQGRWPSPDPAGLAAANPTDPQSWNRYGYVRNSPLNHVDPTGLFDFIEPPGWGDDCDTNMLLCPVGGGDDGNGDGGGGGGGPHQKIEQPPPREGGGGHPSPPKGIKKLVCSIIPQGRVTSVSGSLGLLGGQTGSLSVVINYNSGQVSVFATGGLQVGWNGAAAASVSTGFVYGNLGSSNSGFSGDFVTGYGSGPVFGGYGSFGNGVSVFGASAGANLTGGAGGGANFTKTTNPLQFSPAVDSLFTTPLDDALSFVRGLVCHQ